MAVKHTYTYIYSVTLANDVTKTVKHFPQFQKNNHDENLFILQQYFIIFLNNNETEKKNRKEDLRTIYLSEHT